MRFFILSSLTTLIAGSLSVQTWAATHAEKAALHADKQLAKLDDGKIAAILAASNTAEVNAGKYAQSHATNTAVRDFAKEMVEAHTADMDQEQKIAGAKKIQPTETEVSKSITSQATTRLEHLMTLTGLEFDRAYLEEQINVHRQLLQNLDRDWIPAAKDKVFTAQLKTTREKVAAHLHSAESLKTKL